jgi:hypothetical protein
VDRRRGQRELRGGGRLDPRTTIAHHVVVDLDLVLDLVSTVGVAVGVAGEV